jgi:hypothetical protein
MGTRKHDVRKFYELMDRLEVKRGGKNTLKDCDGRMGWPKRGIYFFFEEGETRWDTELPRVVRIGTHAIKTRKENKEGGTKLWTRLKQHKGNGMIGEIQKGNHRGSIFRKHVGLALIDNDCTNNDISEFSKEHWGKGQSANREIKKAEEPLEIKVSQKICDMPFLVLDVPTCEERKSIERESIRLLTYPKPIDPPSMNWLGGKTRSPKIKESGLWNVEHVSSGEYDPAFLDKMSRLIDRM